MCIYMSVLVFNNIINHKVDRSNLISFKSYVNSRLAQMITKHDRKFIAEILLIIVRK